ncbi:MAG: Imm27 family immunity protein [Steroidobacteraceae bacterium]
MKASALLSPDEAELIGQWLAGKRKIAPDPTCVRIEWLVNERLVPLGSNASGESELYRDPETGKLWERTWPQSQLPGGGPPRLVLIAADAARARYGALADG